MIPNSRQLALRDPAFAAMAGIIGNGGSNFGAESAFAGDFGGDFEGEFGLDMYGEDGFGDEWGADSGAAAPVPAKPTATAAMQAWQQRRAQMMATRKRQQILHPNTGSNAKIQRYAFSLSTPITLGTPLALNMQGNPDVTLRPQVVTMNAPSPMFVFVTEISVANVKATVGGGNVEDAYNYSALGVGKTLDMPTLSPAQRALVLGSYSGFVPPGFAAGPFISQLYFTTTFKGPADVVS